MKTSRIRGLYVITPAHCGDDELDRKVGQALAGGATLVQYRGKDVPATVAHRQALLVNQRCRAHGALCVINDDVELAARVGADGVHLGRGDMPLGAARRALGRSAVIGASCYDDLPRAQEAVQAGADYVAFGSFYPSRVKPCAVRPPVELLTAGRALGVPVVAIGGIDAGNARVLIDHGADAIAVISAVFEAEDPEDAARELARLFEHRLPTEAI